MVSNTKKVEVGNGRKDASAKVPIINALAPHLVFAHFKLSSYNLLNQFFTMHSFQITYRDIPIFYISVL